MVGSIDNSLSSGNYVAALQDALGNSGASVSISGKSSIISGTPSGISSYQAPLASDTVSLSARAKKYLSDANTALGIIQTILDNSKNVDAGGLSAGTKTDQPEASIVRPQKTENQSSAGASKDTASSAISETLSAAQTQVNDPNYIYLQWNNPNTLGAIKLGLSPDEATSFQKAFDSKTLVVRHTEDIPGFNLSSSTTITGTSESTAAGSYNGQLQQVLQRQEGGYALIVPTTFGGGLYVTWGTSNATLSN